MLCCHNLETPLANAGKPTYQVYNLVITQLKLWTENDFTIDNNKECYFVWYQAPGLIWSLELR